MKSIDIKGVVYTGIDLIIANIRDSFVSDNKLVTSSNVNRGRPSSGETRLYIGSHERVMEENFFGDFSNRVNYVRPRNALPNNICIFSKNNLLSYQKSAKNEYLFPSQNYFYDISNTYDDKLVNLESFTNDNFIPFTLFHHDGQMDRDRFYINSVDSIWSLFRSIALPVISQVYIYKMQNNIGNIVYLFELKLHREYSSDFDEKLLIKEVIEDYSIGETEKQVIVNSRLGQGKYKNNLIQTMNQCPFTLISDRNILRASHIKPWAASNNYERIDGYNGLLLTPTYDVLFDRGLISFKNNGELLVSPCLSSNLIRGLLLDTRKTYNIENEHGNRNSYLEYHRKFVFKKTDLIEF